MKRKSLALISKSASRPTADLDLRNQTTGQHRKGRRQAESSQSLRPRCTSGLPTHAGTLAGKRRRGGILVLLRPPVRLPRSLSRVRHITVSRRKDHNHCGARTSGHCKARHTLVVTWAVTVVVLEWRRRLPESLRETTAHDGNTPTAADTSAALGLQHCRTRGFRDSRIPGLQDPGLHRRDDAQERSDDTSAKT